MSDNGSQNDVTLSNLIQSDTDEIHDDREYINENRLVVFIKLAKEGKRNFKGTFTDEEILDVFNIRRNKHLTKAGALIFSEYPQMYFPQLSIHAVKYPGYEVGEVGTNQERFLDNENITGSIPDMLEQAINFIKSNIRVETIIVDGKRTDKYEYPMTALREAILNALVHRDYSSLNERAPIKLDIFKDRIEITSPGEIYGNFNLDQLSSGIQVTRNDNIVNILEILKICENRYTGIPTIRKEMKNYGLPEPLFISRNNQFKVIFYNNNERSSKSIASSISNIRNSKRTDSELIEFCKIPRSPKQKFVIDNRN